jgi:hypothetical protein
MTTTPYNLTKGTTNNTINLITIQNMINSFHNPSLIIPNESPNGNRITHIYDDGTITNQKGGWAYLKRSEFNDFGPIITKPVSNLIFPITNIYNNMYAIVTHNNAIKIRNSMIEWINQK